MLRRGSEAGSRTLENTLTRMSLHSDPVTYYTALHIAVLRNQPDMVELLVRHGADINRRDRVRVSSSLGHVQ